MRATVFAQHKICFKKESLKGVTYTVSAPRNGKDQGRALCPGHQQPSPSQSQVEAGFSACAAPRGFGC